MSNLFGHISGYGLSSFFNTEAAAFFRCEGQALRVLIYHPTRFPLSNSALPLFNPALPLFISALPLFNSALKTERNLYVSICFT
jgi:hypothetical protein